MMEKMPRRDALRLVAGCALAALGAQGCSAGRAAGARDGPAGSSSSGSAPASPGRHLLAKVSAVTAEGALDVSAAAGRPAYLVESNGSVTLLSAMCTHAGCLVTWQKQRNRFVCPCHGGTYDGQGAVLGGPPPRPLDQLPIRVENGGVYLAPDTAATP
jgi:cytochrome b6-f complex iron-sulfur subunit